MHGGGNGQKQMQKQVRDIMKQVKKNMNDDIKLIIKKYSRKKDFEKKSFSALDSLLEVLLEESDVLDKLPDTNYDKLKKYTQDLVNESWSSRETKVKRIIEDAHRLTFNRLIYTNYTRQRDCENDAVNYFMTD
eukprot:UN26615